MTEREDMIADRAARNLDEFMERGPGLRWSTRTWVIAKDSTVRKVLLGGLGGMGVGRMWTRTDGDHYSHADDPTYADAPEMSWAESDQLGGGKGFPNR
jgi:hypothetical protein